MDTKKKKGTPLSGKRLTRKSYQNLKVADSWDAWPLDPEPGYMLVLFRNGFSSVAATSEGPFVWEHESAAASYLKAHAPDLPRVRCDPGPRKLYFSARPVESRQKKRTKEST